MITAFLNWLFTQATLTQYLGLICLALALAVGAATWSVDPINRWLDRRELTRRSIPAAPGPKSERRRLDAVVRFPARGGRI